VFNYFAGEFCEGVDHGEGWSGDWGLEHNVIQ